MDAEQVIKNKRCPRLSNDKKDKQFFRFAKEFRILPLQKEEDHWGISEPYEAVAKCENNKAQVFIEDNLVWQWDARSNEWADIFCLAFLKGLKESRRLQAFSSRVSVIYETMGLGTVVWDDPWARDTIERVDLFRVRSADSAIAKQLCLAFLDGVQYGHMQQTIFKGHPYRDRYTKWDKTGLQNLPGDNTHFAHFKKRGKPSKRKFFSLNRG